MAMTRKEQDAFRRTLADALNLTTPETSNLQWSRAMSSKKVPGVVRKPALAPA